MNLVIDAGNSQIKYAVFDREQILLSDKSDYEKWEEVINMLKKKFSLKKAIVSSVGKDVVLHFLKGIEKIIDFNYTTKIPLKNLYKSPATLGMDRLAAAVGASNIYPKENVLVIDAGTAITYEFISSKGEYLGGNISPGLYLRFKALHEFTGKLPLVEPSETISLIGENTNGAILNGVVNGLKNEINGVIHDFEREVQSHKVILTGGDCIFFDKILKNFIFVEPNLVLLGLNRILLYNVEGNR